MAGKKLLVADDSLTIQKVIRLALSNEGYEIQAVSDGNDAIQQISLFRPDAVLVDVSLPGKTAFEVKRAINEHSDLEEVRFILMSSAFEKVDEAQAAEVRFHGRLTKPFDPAHLRQVLTETLSQVEARRFEPTSILERPLPGGAPNPPETQAASPSEPAVTLQPEPVPAAQSEPPAAVEERTTSIQMPQVAVLASAPQPTIVPVATPQPTAPAPQPVPVATPVAPSIPVAAPAAAAAPVAPQQPSIVPATQPAPVAAAPVPAPQPMPVAAAPLPPIAAPPALEPTSTGIGVFTPSPDIDFDSSLETAQEPAIHGDWSTPLQGNEPVFTPPPPAEDFNKLWETEPTLKTEPTRLTPMPGFAPAPGPAPASTPAPAPLAHAAPPAPAGAVSLAPHGIERDADIKHLTESTIRMSGLDDFEWSVNEPSLKPSTQMMDTGDTSFQIEAIHDQASNIPPFKPEFGPDLSASPPDASQAASPSDFYLDQSEPTKRLSRPIPYNPANAFVPDEPPSSLPAHQSNTRPNMNRPLGPAPAPAHVPPVAHPPAPTEEASVVGISADQIEELLRKELQKLLPDLAEKIIKQEIHRMLSTEGS